MRIALGIEYAGCNYYGWQTQSITPTIQETIELALSEVANEKVIIHCAGRTDTGVHAIQQVVHFETSSIRKSHNWVLGVNSKLPKTRKPKPMPNTSFRALVFTFLGKKVRK